MGLAGKKHKEAAMEKTAERQIIFHEDDFACFVKRNWPELGLTPVFLKLLVEWSGWWAELVDDCLRELVGTDYADIKMTQWVERLKDKGYEFPEGKPVLKVINDILIEAWDGDAHDFGPHMMDGLNSN